MNPLLHRFRHDGTPDGIRCALRCAIHTRKWCLSRPINPHTHSLIKRSTEAVFILAGQLRSTKGDKR